MGRETNVRFADRTTTPKPIPARLQRWGLTEYPGARALTPRLPIFHRFRLPPSLKLWRTSRPVSPFSYVGQDAALLGFARFKALRA